MREFDIAIAGKRNPDAWRNVKWSWEKIVDKLSHTIRTSETEVEYSRMNLKDKSAKKDHGGFVGGYLKDGLRKKNTVLFRSLVALDADKADPGTWDVFTMLFNCTAALHTTHSHTPGSYRTRIIIPLSRNVTPDEYQAISRKIAYDVGMTYFDRTTFQNERLMFWPSTPSDGEFIFERQEGPLLDPDEILSWYADPMDSTAWPVMPDEDVVIRQHIKSAEDPLEKKGLVGAFCRAFDIHDAIAQFIPDSYTDTVDTDRYTYTGGSAAAGAIVYDDKFIFSHHGTDPVSGMLVNAFDLVRVHLYGALDKEDRAEGNNKLQSFKKMIAMISDLPEVRQHVASADLTPEQFEEGLQEVPEDPHKWKGLLTVDPKGEYESTITNYALILMRDEEIRTKLAYDEFAGRYTVLQALPSVIPDKTAQVTRAVYPRFFSDDDGAQLRGYIEMKYGIYNMQKFKDALRATFRNNEIHPVRAYLETLQWDGTSRIETLLMDYLGAEDLPYTRNVTLKMLMGGIARIYYPGIKFDNLLTLVGPQGCGKSRFVKKLAVNPDWINQSFVFSSEGNRSAEAVRGKWIVEVSELVGLRKAEVTSIKQFFATEIDSYRQAYGEYLDNYRRQCIFIGTTNEHDFITDPTGGRRFWPVSVTKFGKLLIDDLPIDQIWAEAKALFFSTPGNTTLWLDPLQEEEAKAVQESYSEEEAREGLIMEYINMKVPAGWAEMNIQDRSHFFHHPDAMQPAGTEERTRICAAEIWCECLGGTKASLNNIVTRPINKVLAKLSGWERTPGKISFPKYGQYKGYIKKD